MAEREDLIILGRTIGTYDGWDGDDSTSVIYYSFKPCDVLSSEMPEADSLSVDYTAGNFTYYNDEGTIYKTLDMLPLLNMVKKS